LEQVTSEQTAFRVLGPVIFSIPDNIIMPI
jgi:hypothetical protein